jgi:hypothetical protein
VNGACEWEAVTLAFSCARTQLPMRPHLAPHELGLGKMPMEVSSGEPGSMLPIAPHGHGPVASPSYQTTIAYTICLTNLPNNRHLHRIGLSSPYTCNQSRRKQPKRVTQIGAFLHFWISEHMSKRDITKMICPSLAPHRPVQPLYTQPITPQATQTSNSNWSIFALLDN